MAGLQASLESAIRIAELTKDYTTVTKLQEQILAKHNEVGALIDASMERCNKSSIVADFIASIQNSSSSAMRTTGDDVPTFVVKHDESRSHCSDSSALSSSAANPT